jgi:hypothetical protein
MFPSYNTTSKDTSHYLGIVPRRLNHVAHSSPRDQHSIAPFLSLRFLLSVSPSLRFERAQRSSCLPHQNPFQSRHRHIRGRARLCERSPEKKRKESGNPGHARAHQSITQSRHNVGPWAHDFLITDALCYAAPQQ